MKTTPELIEKYQTGKATTEEKAIIEEWLNNTADEDCELSEEDLCTMERNIWASLPFNTVPIKERNGRKLYKKLSHYRTAAAILVFISMAALLFSDHLTGNTGSDRTIPGYLKITSGNGTALVASESCEIDFSGYLQLVNASQTVKTVICKNGKTFHLLPGVTYYLETVSQEHYLINENDLSPEDDFIRYVRGKVCINQLNG